MSDGKTFLRLNGVARLGVSAHALEQVCERAGLALAREEARELFLEAAQVTPETVLLMGFRIAYGRRKWEGQESWYFLLPSKFGEMVAVVGRDDPGKEPCWVTTLVFDSQTELYRAGGVEAAVSVPPPRKRPGPGERRKRRKHGRARMRDRVRVPDGQVPEIREFFAARGERGAGSVPASPADPAADADTEAA